MRLPALLCLLSAAACAHPHEEDTPDGMTPPDQRPAEVMPGDVTLIFKAVAGDKAFACSGEFHAGTGKEHVHFSDLRLFIHDVRLITAAGAEVPLSLKQGHWQHQDVALLDFENKSGSCGGTAETNTQITGTVPDGSVAFTGVRFGVGVPFALNHADAAKAPPPLNQTAMFWSWQGGYKHLRLEGRNHDGAVFLFHLGSTGCMKDGQGAVTGCSAPNRPQVRLEGLDPRSGAVVLDLAKLLEASDLDAAPECMSGPDAASCGPLFTRLGLPWGGAQAPAQIVFRAGSR